MDDISPSSPRTSKTAKTKCGHRRVTTEGTVTYKRKTTSDIQKAIQLGIKMSVTLAHKKAKRDMLLKDFGVVETMSFPRGGGKDTPSHELSDFKFKTFAPIAFRYFREVFQVNVDEYLFSICDHELKELSNAGASGSIFYITYDDEFIIKTVQHKEAGFLQKLLPEYYINLIQHPRTLLPKFYGLYCYQTMGKNIRFVVMNNLLPSITIHERYDLKGSTYKRLASAAEKAKKSPTLKDLDFREKHPDGLYLEVETYDALINTIQRDCRVLESFSIMDYSLLLGIHNLDQNKSEQNEMKKLREQTEELGAKTEKGQELTNKMKEISIYKKNIDEYLKNDDMKLGEMGKPKEEVIVKLELSKSPDKNETINDHENNMPKAVMSSTICSSGDSKFQQNQNNKNVSTSEATTSTSSVRLRNRNFNRQDSRCKSMKRIAAYSTVLESIHAPIEMIDLDESEEDIIPSGGIPARNYAGDRLILFMGIIDILQSYRTGKKLEHNVKAIFLDPESISVCNPTFYSIRFQEFFSERVFKKISSLDQPQILGLHVRRFRNIVHMAMKHSSKAKKDSPEKKELLETDLNKERLHVDSNTDVHLATGDKSTQLRK